MQVIAGAKLPKGIQNKACWNLLKHNRYDMIVFMLFPCSPLRQLVS
jgi:hypothetical protein